MTDSPHQDHGPDETHGPGALPGVPAPLPPAPPVQGEQPARPTIGTAGRIASVLLSPGKVFEDVRRNWRDWWVPIVVCMVIAVIFTSMYASRYDMPTVLKEQLQNSSAMKMVAGLAGPAARDKAVAQALVEVSVPSWQIALGLASQVVVGTVLTVWFFTFLYSLIAAAMGWLSGSKLKSLWISLVIVVCSMLVVIVGSSVSQFMRAAAAKSAGLPAGETVPPSAGITFTLAAISFLCAIVIGWGLSRVARDAGLGRILAAVSYSLVPLALGATVGIIIVLVKAPDATPMDEIVPANLTSLLGLKSDGAGSAMLASLATSLGLFTIWSYIVAIVGLSKGLKKSIGAAAGVVLTPWLIVVIAKAIFAAAFAG